MLGNNKKIKDILLKQNYITKEDVSEAEDFIKKTIILLFWTIFFLKTFSRKIF